MLKTLLTLSAIIAFTVGTAAAGAFDQLSPGNQKIVQALCDAQANVCGGTGSLTLDQIAGMKPKGMGWGEFFHKNSTLFPGARNLGEAVSNFERAQRVPATGLGTTSPTGTTITSASGKSQVVGKPEQANKSGKSRFDDDAGNSGWRSDSSGSGRGYGYGRGDSGVSGGGMGHGGGRWK